jgi:hypothetical protein
MELNANMDKEYYNAVKELLNYDIDDVKTMVEIGILTKKMSKNFKKGTENEKISLNEKVMYETEVESLKKENEKLQKRYYSMREEMRDEFYEKQQKSNDKFQEMVRYYQEELNNSKLSNNEIVNATIREKTELLREKIVILNEKLENSEKINGEKQEMIDKLNKKYVLSTKGKQYETDIYNNLCEIVCKKYDNVWEITHVGSKLGKKGDIILEHKLTGIRIMLDPKNHDKVDASHRKKFIDDMKNVNNKFHGGIMISRGSIDTKRSFDKEVIANKVLWYLSYYTLGNEQFLMTQIEVLHQKILGEESGAINPKKLRNLYIKNYKEIKNQTNIIERQHKYFKDYLESISKEYTNFFDGDIEVDSINDNSSISTMDETKYINEYFDKCIIRNEGKHCKVSDIKEQLDKLIPKLTAKKLTRCLNSWKERKFNDSKKVTCRSVMLDYELVFE